MSSKKKKNRLLFESLKNVSHGILKANKMFILKRDSNPLHLMQDEGTMRLFVDLVIKDKNSFPTEINNIEFNGLID